MSKFSSIFSQLLTLFSKNDFYRAIHETQAEPENQNIRGNNRQCGQNANLDSITSNIDGKVSETPLYIRMVIIESYCVVTHELVYLPRLMELAR